MRYFSNLKNALFSLRIIQFFLTCSPRFKRRDSFGPNGASLPVSVPPTAPQPPSASPSPGVQPLMVGQSNTTTAATPAPPLPPRSIAELAIPAALSVAIYGSIPPAVQLTPGGVLYPPLIAFISLAVFTSLGTIVYALAKPDGSPAAGARTERVKQRAMAMAIGFLLVAFMLRVLLLLPVTSFGLAGFVLVVGGAVMAVLLFLPWKEEDHVAPEPAPDYSGEIPS